MNRKQRRAGITQLPLIQKSASQAVAEIFATALGHSQAGRSSQVVACFRRAVKITPDFAAAHYNLGNALGEQGKHKEAIICFRKALELAPGLTEAHSNLGAALKQQGRLDEAAAHCRKAIALAPRFSLAHFNLGTVLDAQRQLDEAAACYRKAINLQPDFADAHLNLAMTLLTLGDMTAGWQEHEWRWKTPQMIADVRKFRQPQWRGEPAEGRTLLIYAEQGFGDTLQFCRYAPLAVARGLRVVMEVPKPLVRLLQSLPGVDLIVGTGEELPSFDLQSPMMSLPGVFGTTVETIPGTSAYLRADQHEVETWRARISAIATHEPRIGLVWAGNSSKDNPALVTIDKRRSVSFDRFQPFLDCPGLQFFSLQKDKQEGPGSQAIDLMAYVGDFADTAALIANLDLVISVDTAAAHLAAALGKPVWLLNRFNSDWRWMVERRDSPWYPTLRLYNQPRPEDWDFVVAEISSDLRLFATGGTFD